MKSIEDLNEAKNPSAHAKKIRVLHTKLEKAWEKMHDLREELIEELQLGANYSTGMMSNSYNFEDDIELKSLYNNAKNAAENGNLNTSTGVGTIGYKLRDIENYLKNNG